MKRHFFLFFSLPLFLFTAEVEKVDKRQITYLMQQNQVKDGIALYQEYVNEKKEHDFEVLQQIAQIILEQGARSHLPEIQLLSMYGASIANHACSIDILEAGILSKEPTTQMACIQFLGRFQDDRCDELLIKAMASDYLPIRMQAGFQLAVRKHRAATGQIEALMYKLPHPFWAYFPQFFAMIGTSEAIAVLKELIDDRDINVRLESILFAAQFHRDDLLPLIRAHVTHSNPAEQEACIRALGALGDSKSIPKIEALLSSQSENVQLAAAISLYQLGKTEMKEHIAKAAKSGDLFAIAALGEIEGSDDLLKELLQSNQMTVEFNAALSLLKLKNTSCIPTLRKFLLKDSRDLGFQPHFSQGKACMAWKVVPSVAAHAKNSQLDLVGVTLSIKEHILKELLQLPEENFIHMAKAIFKHQQNDLVPLVVSLLENHQTEGALHLLKQEAEKGSNHLSSAYCNLALFRLGKPGPYEKVLKAWVSDRKNVKLIQFRPSTSKDIRFSETSQELTVEESSKLLIDSYLALAEKDDALCIDVLLEMIKTGNANNRYTLSGILIRAIQ